MNILIFDDMQQCNEAEVSRMLPLVSEQRRQQAMQFKHLFGQFACLKAYEMLMSLTNASSPLLFTYNEHGKPFIPSAYFSISHCKNGIAVATSQQPVGIDIESVRNFDESLIKMTMNNAEAAQIHNSDNPAMEFIKLWTRKEAVLKLRGTGITDDLPSVLNGNEIIETHINIDKGYAYSIAIN